MARTASLLRWGNSDVWIYNAALLKGCTRTLDLRLQCTCEAVHLFHLSEHVNEQTLRCLPFYSWFFFQQVSGAFLQTPTWLHLHLYSVIHLWSSLAF